MKTSTIVIATALLLAGPALAKQEKSLVCHVGNQLGSQGETWMENRNCDVPEGWEGEYTCPDAGKVDLIVVANAHKHLNNESHSWDGLSDYDPVAMGASADSTEDLNGDGIDDGCEIPSAVACPCWDEQDLLAVTAENQATTPYRSCGGSETSFGVSAYINTYYRPSDPGVEGGFSVITYGDGSAWCATRDYDPVTGEPLVFELGAIWGLSPEEGQACLDQIVARCQSIGTPIVYSQ